MSPSELICCGEKIALHALSIEDAEALFMLWSHPDVARFMNIPPIQHQEAVAILLHTLQEQQCDQKAIRFTIRLRKNNTIIGSCGFNHIDLDQQCAEISYELGKPYWQKNYMSEAIELLLNYGKEVLQLKRIEATVYLNNVASIALLQKHNFIEEYYFEEYGTVNGIKQDALLYILQLDTR